jgi:RimJ/RimL family protein N-acetyltransferase
MLWIEHPVELVGNRVRLEPLERKHFDELCLLANESAIWQFMAVDFGNATIFRRYLESAVLKRATGEQYPFVVVDQNLNRLAGATMFHSMHPGNRKLEIGYTWYHPDWWGTGINIECKLLMLTYCFDELKTIRVQFVTDEHNLRSRNALKRIGATEEGLLRNERIRYNGAYRNTVMFSIVESEWPSLKVQLKAQCKIR